MNQKQIAIIHTEPLAYNHFPVEMIHPSMWVRCFKWKDDELEEVVGKFTYCYTREVNDSLQVHIYEVEQTWPVEKFLFLRKLGAVNPGEEDLVIDIFTDIEDYLPEETNL